MVNFSHITGEYFDNLVHSVHNKLRPGRLRYQGTILKPYPLITDKGVQSTSDVGFELSTSENLRGYSASIPDATAGQIAATAFLPDAVWELSLDQGVTWHVVRVFGEPQFHPGGQRWAVEFKRGGIGEDLSGYL